MRPAKLFLSLLMAFATSALAQPDAAVPPKKLSVVRVNVTNQAYDFYRPWSKKAPYSREAIGAVVPENRVLVTAELVANATYLELEKPESGEKVAATVAVVDFEANLALLQPVNDQFLDGFEPLEVADAKVGDHVSAWQLESSGELLKTGALLTAVNVGKYPIADVGLLIYKMTASLQYRDASFTLPMVKDGKLIGLLMRYDTRAQNVDVIPAPVLRHFLEDAKNKDYAGFPRAGVRYSPMRDPQLRRHTGAVGKVKGGVYITDVAPGSPAADAGVAEGDVLVSVADEPIDQDGNYLDPLYGKIPLSHLISMKKVGEKVNFELFRDGKARTVEVPINNRPVKDFVIEPYVIDTAPKFYVLGGLVLQELSRQYLREWGGDWETKAPERFVYFDRFQDELFGDYDGKVLIMTGVLPSPSTVGYEQLGQLIVKRINGKPLHSMADVAEAVKKPIDGFHQLEFDEVPGMIFLDAEQVAKDEPALMSTYGLPEMKRVE